MTPKQMKKAVEKVFSPNRVTFFETGSGRRFSVYHEQAPDTAPVLALGASTDKIERYNDDNGTYWLAFYTF